MEMRLNMNQKELSELRRRFRPEKSAISRIQPEKSVTFSVNLCDRRACVHIPDEM